jgi:hypothetical protein
MASRFYGLQSIAFSQKILLPDRATRRIVGFVSGAANCRLGNAQAPPH